MVLLSNKPTFLCLFPLSALTFKKALKDLNCLCQVAATLTTSGGVMDCTKAAWALNRATHVVKTKVPLEQRMVFVHIVLVYLTRSRLRLLLEYLDSMNQASQTDSRLPVTPPISQVSSIQVLLIRDTMLDAVVEVSPWDPYQRYAPVKTSPPVNIEMDCDASRVKTLTARGYYIPISLRKAWMAQVILVQGILHSMTACTGPMSTPTGADSGLDILGLKLLAEHAQIKLIQSNEDRLWAIEPRDI
ncbi:uncharacterized protein BJ212DRAFT_1299593 [Suillus subaureus]|uniref:Uncharacterized protein n=1 Tax=Suillus subaureus TaxID=48587 RepID=A0A9P7EC21_9AGAM|nr:uncharacterized protein BJ212DRAFT_1299593 [Suillus subaureus]KAG1816878.1 hypothetical protein BJ212DRAFT_1299593 [Suillus subaureus]